MSTNTPSGLKHAIHPATSLTSAMAVRLTDELLVGHVIPF